MNGAEKARSVRDAMPRLLSIFFMLLKASNNLLYLAVMTTLLEKAGANSLPWVYLLVNVLFIIIQFQFMTRIVGREGHWLLSFVSWPSAILSFAAAWIFPTDIVPLLIGYYVLTMLIDLTTNQGFTAMLNHFLSIGESKRLLPVIYASGSIGFILSGLLLKFILDFIGLKGLLVINGLIVLGAGVILRMLKPVEDLRLEEVEEAPAVTTASEPAVEQTAMQHPLARLLIISSFIILFNKYLIDFLFAASLSSYFTETNSLASFMGIFGAATDFAVIGLQTFVMNRVFARFPIGRVLAFMPLILTLLCCLAAFSLKFSLIAVVQFLVLLNSKNFTVPATTILMGAISQKDRVYYRRDMSIACSLSSAVVGAFLLLARSRISYEMLFLIASGMYVLMAVVHVMLDRAYLKTLRQAIVSKEEDELDDQVASLRFVQLHERLQQLQALLGDENPRIRARAIDEIASLPEKYATELLEPLLAGETDSRCLNAIARSLLSIAPENSARHIVRLLNETDDNRLRADIIEAVGKARLSDIGEDCLLGFLNHQHHRVSASAVISVVRLTRQRSSLELAMKRLAAMAVDSQELMRASAAAVMGELGLPLFVPALGALAGENNLIVASNAATALSRIQTPAAMAVLENMLSHENDKVTQKAEELLETTARESVSRISRLLPGITAEERQKLSARLRSGRHQESHELLAAILCVDNLDKRRNLIGILEKAAKNTLLNMNRCISIARDNQVELTIAPLLKMAREDLLLELPEWAPLLSAIAGGALEKPDENVRFMLPVNDLLAWLWSEFVVLCDLAWPEKSAQLWLQRSLCAVKIIACCSLEPAAMIKSIREIKDGRAFARGMAAEYLENRAGRKLSQKMIQLFAPTGPLPPDAAAAMNLAASLGVTINSEMVAESRSRLEKLKILMKD